MRGTSTGSTIMTSNRPLEDWGELIGDVPSATTILDCFLHQSEIITITGKSYRLRNQKPASGRCHRTKTSQCADQLYGEKESQNASDGNCQRELCGLRVIMNSTIIRITSGWFQPIE